MQAKLFSSLIFLFTFLGLGNASPLLQKLNSWGFNIELHEEKIELAEQYTLSKTINEETLFHLHYADLKGETLRLDVPDHHNATIQRLTFYYTSGL